MPENVMLQEAIEAVRQGQASRARDLLTRLLRADSSNPEYWMWLSAVVETQKEQIFCLESVLRLDPENTAARQGLVLLGAMAPDPNVAPVPPIRREWEAAAADDIPDTFLGRLWYNPALRYASLAVALVLACALIAAGVFGVKFGRQQLAAARPTHTLGPSPTMTLTPTYIGARAQAPTRTPRQTAAPTPLAMLLEATYTPTPIYVATPHSISEAFSAGMRAFKKGEWEQAAGFFDQARDVDPSAADIPYYVAESRANLGDYAGALELYQEAIEVDEFFAPAYLGQARARLALDPQAEIAEDLQKSVELDPSFGEAQLEYAALLIRSKESEAAQDMLDEAALSLPSSPLVPLLRAQAAYSLEDYETALAQGRQALDLDLTLLPAYRIVGQAAAELGERVTAIKNLQTYLAFTPTDAEAWTSLGRVYLLGDTLNKAIEAFGQALDVEEEEDRDAPIYLLRGMTYLEMNKGQEAVNDLLLARSISLKNGERIFEIDLALGRALWAADRIEDARGQFNTAEGLARSGAQKAQVYYYRAQVSELLDLEPAALRDWRLLAGLDEKDVPEEWMELARERIKPTPTPTSTRTPARTQTRTPSITRTPAPDRTPSPEADLTPTRTPFGTRTAAPTRTPRPTASPTPKPSPTSRGG